MSTVRNVQQLALSLSLLRPARRALTGGLLMAGLSATILAQASSGVTGTVSDNSGAVIGGAAVTIVNNGTQSATKAVTTSSGTYAVTGLLPGRYTITVSAPGFSREVKNEVNVEVSVTSTIDFNLQAGSGDQTVNVTADLISLNTTQPELGTTIEPIVVTRCRWPWAADADARSTLSSSLRPGSRVTPSPTA